MAETTRGQRAAEERRQRAEEALKANLKRRKEQARARRASAPEPDQALQPGEETPEDGEA